ncbi:MAG: hypothetical protein RIT10_260 [Bacteroidota bacterium]|jgi:hypothetical protein
MKSTFLNFVVFSSVLLFLLACEKDTTEEISFDYEYYDLTPGRFCIYDVVDIEHDENQAVQHDTTYYQLKTVVGDTFIDNSGRITRKFLRYTRDSIQDNWLLKDVWTTLIENNKAELVEENQRIVKLVFKPTYEKVWNINMFNVSSKINAKYAAIDQPFTIGNQVFDKTLKVDIQNFFSLVDDRVKYDVYAKNVGLIYKYFKDNTIANFDKNTIKKGKELYYTLVSYGIE